MLGKGGEPCRACTFGSSMMIDMKIPPPPHVWDVTPAAAIGVQNELKSRVRVTVPLPLESVRLAAGVDVSSAKDDPLLTAGIVVWDRRTGSIVEAVSARCPATFPYVPGLLSFREIPAILQAVKRLTLVPDVWLVDGQGIAHPRRLGIAAHLGVLLDRPTIGVAKSRLTGSHAALPPEAGSETPLLDGDEWIGTVLRSKSRCNPLYLSPGHLIDHPSTVLIVKACLRGYRLPEPTRLVHLHVNAVRTGDITQQTLL